MGFQPLFDNVVIRPDTEDDTTDGGIIIPDAAKEKSCIGTVVSVAKEKDVVKVGERVMYSKYAGTEFELEGETLLLVRDEDILGVYA